jgi:hypothetical protein
MISTFFPWIRNKRKTSKPTSIQTAQCPFYGFVGAGDMMIYTCGNGCGLEGDHVPCRMCLIGNIPDWNSCDYCNVAQNRQEIESRKDTCVVFPKAEFYDGPVQDGIKLRDWIDHF